MLPRKSWAPWFAGRVEARPRYATIFNGPLAGVRVCIEREQGDVLERHVKWAGFSGRPIITYVRPGEVIEPLNHPCAFVEVPNPPTPAPSHALILSIVTVILAVIAITIWKAMS